MTIDADYQAAVTASASKLFWWKFGETTGPTLADTVGSANITLETAPAAPTLGVTGLPGGNAVRFTQASSQFAKTPALDLTAYSDVCAEVIASADDYTTFSTVLLEFGTNVNSSTVAFSVGLNDNTSEAATGGTVNVGLKGNSNYSIGNYRRQPQGELHHYLFRFNKTASTNEVSLYVDGVLQTATSRPFNANNSNAFGNLVLYLASRAGTSLYTSCTMAHLVIYSAFNSSDLAARVAASGLVPHTEGSLTYAVGDLHGNFHNGSTDNPRLCCGTRLNITTDASYIRFTGISSTNVFETPRDLGLRINGVAQSPISFPANQTREFIVPIGTSGTTRNVEISCGAQLLYPSDNTTVLGNYMTPGRIGAIDGTVSLTTPLASSTDWHWFWGNSIHAGYLNTSPGTDAPPAVLSASGRKMLNDSWGSRAFYHSLGSLGVVDTVKSQSRADFLASKNLKSLSLDCWWNDWGGAAGAAWTNMAACMAAVSDFITRFSAASPSTVIYCWTMTRKVDDVTPNAHSETPAQWRTAIGSMVTTQISSGVNIRLYDGTAYGTGPFADSIHLTTTGSFNLATHYNTFLYGDALTITGTATGGTYDFGAVTTNVPQSRQFTIANGANDINILGTLSISGSGWSITGTNPSGTTLQRTGSTTVTVTGNFSSPGSKTGTLTIPSNDPATPYVINLTATASVPVATTDDDQLALSLELAM